MSLWVDKYRPKTIDDLSYNSNLTNLIKSLSENALNLPHLLIYGNSGSGKKTRSMILLKNIFNSNNVYKLKIDIRSFTNNSNRKFELNVISSQFHLEITPSDIGNNDKLVIQQLIKEIAQLDQINYSSSTSSSSNGNPIPRFKVIIINDADSLSKDAQAALRRTMEKYSKNIRIIMISNSISSIIDPIKSRCLLIRSASPTTNDINKILKDVAIKEKITINDNSILDKIANHTNCNLRSSLLMFESMSLANDLQLSLNTTLILPDWKVVLSKLANSIFQSSSGGSNSVQTIVMARKFFYDLLAHCIPANLILHQLTMIFLQDQRAIENQKLLLKIVELASRFDERLCLGNKSIFHLEGFVANVMLAIQQN